MMLLAHKENHVHLLGGYTQPHVLEMHLMEDTSCAASQLLFSVDSVSVF